MKMKSAAFGLAIVISSAQPSFAITFDEVVANCGAVGNCFSAVQQYIIEQDPPGELSERAATNLAISLGQLGQRASPDKLKELARAVFLVGATRPPGEQRDRIMTLQRTMLVEATDVRSRLGFRDFNTASLGEFSSSE